MKTSNNYYYFFDDKIEIYTSHSQTCAFGRYDMFDYWIQFVPGFFFEHVSAYLHGFID